MNKIITIAHREAILSVSLALLYMLGWWISAYTVPADALWHGWPLWFLLSCLFNPLLFVGLCAVMVKRYFKLVALDGDELRVSDANNAQALPEYLTQTTTTQVTHTYITNSQSTKDGESKLTDAAFPLSSSSAPLRSH